MECPRCQLTLQSTQYENQDVDMCGNCWGYWLKRSQLESIVNDATYQFNKSEQKAVEKGFFMDGDVDRQGQEPRAITCPVCQGVLERKKFHAHCPVQIDECPEHGIWLDTGEIKDLQIFIEKHLKNS